MVPEEMSKTYERSFSVSTRVDTTFSVRNASATFYGTIGRY